MGSAGSRFFTLAALAAVLYAIPADAQNGRISGVVRDDRGVGMSGAMVRALNQRTGASSRTTSAADGSYTVSALSPGVYTVVASLPGLRPVTLEAVTVTAMLREQELKDVPFSVAAATAQVLRSRWADNIEAIAANV